MRIYRNQLAIRVLGTITGVGFLAVGVFSIVGPGYELTALERDRSFWFGVTAVIGGVWAIGVSWLDSDLSGVWCRPPERRVGALRRGRGEQ